MLLFCSSRLFMLKSRLIWEWELCDACFLNHPPKTLEEDIVTKLTDSRKGNFKLEEHEEDSLFTPNVSRDLKDIEFIVKIRLYIYQAIVCIEVTIKIN